MGDPTKIIYRSMWERDVMIHFDQNKNVKAWSSEEVIVPYISPVDNRGHRYFPDFLARVQKPDGSIAILLIEVKPKKQTVLPVPPKKNPTRSRRFMKEAKTYSVNHAKWRAAENFCIDKGWRFVLMTEYDIYGSTGKKQNPKKKKNPSPK